MEPILLTHLLLVGVVIVASMAMRSVATAVGFSPLLGYLILGVLLQSGTALEWIPALLEHEVFPFLADLGIIALLFRVGLESNLERLLAELPTALWISVGDVFGSGLIAFGVAYGLLGWSFIPSLFTASALTVTSVGVTVTLWSEAGRIDTREGTILVDVAELDDVVGILLMSLLFALAPLLHTAPTATLWGPLATTLGSMLVKLTLFGAACLLFARHLERPMTRGFERLHAGEGTMLVILGVGIVVAALAELSGLSIAIGAFFAGLLFSRDPSATQYLDAFRPLHDLLAPFFFVGIGLHLTPTALVTLDSGVVLLLLAAVAGKLLGAALPAYTILGPTGALALGVSLIPRAEIALIIMQRGLELGPWAVSPAAFAAVVLVSAVTVVGVPLLLRPILASARPGSAQ